MVKVIIQGKAHYKDEITQHVSLRWDSK